MVDEPPLQLQGEMSLGAADQDRLQQFTEGLVGDLCRDPQAGDLLLVLDEALLLHGEAEVGEAQPRRDRGQGAVAGHGQMVLLDGERLDAGGARLLGGGDRRIAGRGGQDVQPELFVGAAVGRITGRCAGAEQDVLAGGEQEYGAGRCGAREVADVRGAGDQNPGAAGGRAPVAQPAAADPIHL